MGPRDPENLNNFCCRYDPNSKCFSYVPAKSLKEHYRAPKKPPARARRPSIEPAVIEIPDRVDERELSQVPIHPVELQRRAETPKWEDEINKASFSVCFCFHFSVCCMINWRVSQNRRLHYALPKMPRCLPHLISPGGSGAGVAHQWHRSLSRKVAAISAIVNSLSRLLLLLMTVALGFKTRTEALPL